MVILRGVFRSSRMQVRAKNKTQIHQGTLIHKSKSNSVTYSKEESKPVAVVQIEGARSSSGSSANHGMGGVRQRITLSPPRFIFVSPARTITIEREGTVEFLGGVKEMEYKNEKEMKVCFISVERGEMGVSGGDMGCRIWMRLYERGYEIFGLGLDVLGRDMG